MRPTPRIAISAALAAALLACGSAKAPTDASNPAPVAVATPTSTAAATGTAAPATSTARASSPAAADPQSTAPDLLAGVTAAADDVAVKFFVDNCVSCHDAKNGSVRSFWPIDKSTFSKALLTSDTLAPTIYFTLYLKAKGILNGKPQAMPAVNIAPETKATLLSVIKWMQIQMPAAVSSAHVAFGAAAASDNGVGVIVNFQCKQPATYREYIRRITNDVFDREPSAGELTLSGTDPQTPVTLDVRTIITERLFSDPQWLKEFETQGLLKFANKLSGTHDVQPLAGFLTPDQATDLGQELYQILLRSYKTQSFKDILLSDTVMVTPRTAALYGCAVPTADWAECQQQAPRGSYFTSLSYLSSKPSSFLRTNNNYGRAALMHFIIGGDVIQPGFGQNGGSETVHPLPDCFKTKDFRGTKSTASIAWNGAGAIPLSANLCQSCHIDREMAAGSILYRPYNTVGQLYGSQAPVDSSDLDYTAAIAPTIVSKVNITGPEQKVTQAFLTGLLSWGDGSEQACVPAVDNLGKDLPLKSVKDLATFLIGDGQVLASGLARHLPRAMSNLDATSEEVIIRINNAYTSGGGKLGPIFKAYFSSETYSCAQ